MKKVLKKVLLIYGDLFMVSVLIWLLSLRKLDKRIDRDIEAGEIEELAINDPLIRWMANIDNCILRTVVVLLCIPYIFIACSNANDKIK